MSVLRLAPTCTSYIWGGQRLTTEYGFAGAPGSDRLAEAWVLSCHKDGPSTIVGGEYDGKTLAEYIKENPDALGANCRRFADFPILTKFIDAKDNLSIQVHPDNEYAQKYEGQFGKTEMWYILDAEPGAFLYFGFKHEISEAEFATRIKSNTLLEVLNAVPVRKGDKFFIESGTLHAIGKGILLAEIQQNSNVTYRIYDYGRKGADGKERELHIDKALAVTKRTPPDIKDVGYPHVASCDYFVVDKLTLDGVTLKSADGTVDGQSFLSILILDGAGELQNGKDVLPFKKGDSFFLPAGSGEWSVRGICDALLTTERP